MSFEPDNTEHESETESNQKQIIDRLDAMITELKLLNVRFEAMAETTITEDDLEN